MIQIHGKILQMQSFRHGNGRNAVAEKSNDVGKLTYAFLIKRIKTPQSQKRPAHGSAGRLLT